MRHILTLAAILSITGCATAYAQAVEDHFKQVIYKKPYTVEICEDKSNNKSNLENFITGAIVGGAIGNNIPGEKNGGATGAILGGILNSERNKGTRCYQETRYEEERQTVYSHSTITFEHNGKQYTLQFKK
jgi:uncharacterized protein YcfJ